MIVLSPYLDSSSSDKCLVAPSRLACSISKGGSVLSSQIELVIPLTQKAAVLRLKADSIKRAACLEIDRKVSLCNTVYVYVA